MDIKSLPEDIRTHFRNAININSINQCVMELILNGLDARATAIAVRINLQTFRIQVVDNGLGITESNMQLIGTRYMTSKCHELKDLKRIKTAGFRGEALASISGVSKKMCIVSRHKDADNSYKKICNSGKWSEVEQVKQRPSEGTTVTVEDFMYNLPVRQKRVNQLELEEIRRSLEVLAIINPNISFSLRNDLTGKMITQYTKKQTVCESVLQFFPDITVKNLLKFKVTKGKICISGLVYNEPFTTNKLQLIYLNKRPINSLEIQKLMQSLFAHQSTNVFLDKSGHPAYVINIRCPHTEVDLTLSPSKKTAEFKHFDIVLKCIEKAVTKLLGNEDLLEIQDKIEIVEHNRRSQCGISQIEGAVQSIAFKRKISKNNCEQIQNTSDEENDTIPCNSKKLRSRTNVGLDNIDSNVFKVPKNKRKPPLRKNKPKRKTNTAKRKDGKIFDLISPAEILQQDCKENKTKYEPLVVNTTNPHVQSKLDKLFDEVAGLKPVEQQAESVYFEQNEKIPTEQSKLLGECYDMNVQPFNSNDLARQSCPTLFEKHVNTQSLVLNSELSSSKENDLNPLLNSTISTNLLEDQCKGKQLIMDMFLKSTAVFPSEEPQTIKAIVTETTKQNLFTQCKSINTGVTMSFKLTSKKTIITNSIHPGNAFEFNLEQNGKDGENMVSKCIQTTMVEKKNQFELNFNCAGEKNNYNITFSKYFRNPQCFPASTNISVIQNSPISLYEYPKQQIPNFQTAFFCPIINQATNFQQMQKSTRKPFNECVSNDNFDFSNFNHFKNDYNEFVGYKKPRERQTHVDECIPLFKINNAVKNFDGIKKQFDFNFNARNSNFSKPYDDCRLLSFNPDVPNVNLHQPFFSDYLQENNTKERYPKKQHATKNHFKHSKNNKGRLNEAGICYSPFFNDRELPQNSSIYFQPNFKKGQVHGIQRKHNSKRNIVEVKTPNFSNLNQYEKMPKLYELNSNPFYQETQLKQKIKPDSKNNLLHLQKRHKNILHQPTELILPQRKFSNKPDSKSHINIGQPNCWTGQYLGCQDQNLFMARKPAKNAQQLQYHAMKNTFVVEDPVKNPLSKERKTLAKQSNKIVLSPRNYFEQFQNLDKNVFAEPLQFHNYINPDQNVFRTEQQPCNFINPARQNKICFESLNVPNYMNQRPQAYALQKDTDSHQFMSNCRSNQNHFQSSANICLPRSRTMGDRCVQNTFALNEPQTKQFRSNTYPMRGNTVNNPLTSIYASNDFKQLQLPKNRNISKPTKTVQQNPTNYLNIVKAHTSELLKPLENMQISNGQSENLLDSTTLQPQTNENEWIFQTLVARMKRNNVPSVFKNNVHKNILQEPKLNLQKHRTEPIHKNNQNMIENQQFRKFNTDPLTSKFIYNYHTIPSPVFFHQKGNSFVDIENFETTKSFEVQSDSFQPLLSSTQYDVVEATGEISKDNNTTCDEIIAGSPCAFTKSNSNNSVLNVSISASKRMKLVSKEFAEQCHREKSSDSEEGEFSNKAMNNKEHTECNNNNIWTQQLDKFGKKYYLHKRTGMTSLFSPKDDINFNFVKRISFVPKGLSPILVEAKQFDVSLSPTTKKQFNKAILQSYEDELNTIKWANYFKENTDVKKFFDDLYKEKTKQFENFIPNIALNKLSKTMIKMLNTIEARHFNKDIFTNLKVIGQLDRKFIITLENKKLILFDQHALHERIRLENITTEYKNQENNLKSTAFDFNLETFEETEMHILKNYEVLFNNLGLFYKCVEDHVKIVRIPTCIYNRFTRNQRNEDDLSTLLRNLIYEHTNMITLTRGATSNIPTIIQNILNSEACRGAIKFGDELTINECNQYIQELSRCSLPFQCAHGRPTLIPLIEIQETLDNEKVTPNLKKLICCLR